jgi:hypothetical protein
MYLEQCFSTSGPHESFGGLPKFFHSSCNPNSCNQYYQKLHKIYQKWISTAKSSKHNQKSSNNLITGLRETKNSSKVVKWAHKYFHYSNVEDHWFRAACMTIGDRNWTSVFPICWSLLSTLVSHQIATVCIIDLDKFKLVRWFSFWIMLILSQLPQKYTHFKSGHRWFDTN